MPTPLQKYIHDYLEATTENNRWLGSELQKLRMVTDPNLTKAAELQGRAQNQLQKIREMQGLLTSLTRLCEVLHIDVDKVVIGD